MSTKVKGVLSGGRALTKWRQQDPAKGTLIQKLIDAVNTSAQNAAVSAVGRITPPPPLNAVNVKVSGEYAHVTFDHSGEISQGVHYIAEVATNKDFIGAHPIHFGPSRTRDPIHMAPLDDSGNPQTWYVRGFPQYPGGNPAKPVNFGGPEPSPITTTGTTRLTWLPSTGSGTASNNGQQSGWGFGKISRRT